MRASVLLVLIGVGMSMNAAGAARELTVKDCIQTIHIIRNEVKLSPNGTHVAYLVQTVNFRTNRNEYDLYVKDLKNIARPGKGVMLWRSDRLSGVRWTTNGKAVIVLSKKGTKNELILLDLIGHQHETLVSSSNEITEYAADANAHVVAFSRLLTQDQRARLTQELTWGYSVRVGDPLFSHFNNFFASRSRYEIVVVHPYDKGARALTTIDTAPSLVSPTKSPLLGLRFLSISPDGKFITFNYLERQAPYEWKANGFVQYLLGNHAPVTVLAVYNLERRSFAKNPFPSPCFAGPARWADDSKAFAIVAGPPIRSSWEKILERQKPLYSFDVGLYEDMYLFVVAMPDGGISRITAGKQSGRYTMSAASLPLEWRRATDELTVAIDANTYVKFEPNGQEWKEIAKFSDPAKRPLREFTVASDGKKAVGVFETTTEPPELFMFDFATASNSVITNLNAAYSTIALGKVEQIQWRNAFGAECNGFLIKPVGFVAGRRYPLVIMAKDWDGSFISDTQYHTAFAPQSLASAGMVVLMANDPSKAQEPKTYPGQLGEAYNWIEMVRSAIDRLASDGLIDRDRVGIVGFSHTSWKVDFMLTHSDIKFAAASSADGGNYNYSVYSVANLDGRLKIDEAMYSGPPYGATFATWLQYAPAFNADKVNTPLLMEYNGEHSVLWFTGLEFFTALQRQGKIVQLYYYPNGDHVLDTPSERVASLTRNVAWFRFWLQGYEGTDPEFDLGLYGRWRAFRDRINNN